MFINLDEFARMIAMWEPDPRQILEIGCGEGMMTERLAKNLPRRRNHGYRYHTCCWAYFSRQSLLRQLPARRGRRNSHRGH